MSATPYQRTMEVFFRDKVVFFSFLFSLVAVALVFMVLLAKMPHQTPSGHEILPLHYNVHFGIDYVGPWYYSLSLPAGGLAILVINLALAWLVRPQGAYLSRIFAIATAFMQLALASAAVFILLFNV